MKNIKIPSYEDCVNLCLDESPFYESLKIIDGYKISLFNYRLSDSRDFNKSFSKEMRGICFIFNEDGSLFKRYLLLHKFFNLNQIEETMYSNIKDFRILGVSNKEDGSVASFIRLPNGNIVGKSKMSFESEQALGMNRLYNSNSDLKRFVDWSLDNDLVAVFEYVAPTNRIVLKYSNEELILLRLRDNKTGEYLDLSKYSDKIGSIKVAPSDVGTLDELVELSHSVEDKEGWIIEFTNGLFIKIKTSWYRNLHSIYTEDLYHENKLIKLIVDEKIDDILCQIPETEVDAHERINKIISVVKNSISEKVNDISKSYDLFLEGGVGKNWEGELRLQLMRKTFALKYRKDKNFAYVMSLSKGRDVYELAKDWVYNQNRNLLVSRSFLKEKDPSLFFMYGKENEIED